MSIINMILTKKANDSGQELYCEQFVLIDSAQEETYKYIVRPYI